jgi:hypothetical protein
LALTLPAAVLGCRHGNPQDAFDNELVCVHIFQPGFKIPDPLLKRYDANPVRRDASDRFHLKIPELLFCSTDNDFLSIFAYFWPIERDAFNDTLKKVTIQYAQAKITGRGDVSEFAEFLESVQAEATLNTMKTAVILTLNDFTRYFLADFLNLWQLHGIGEVVLFKDPSKPPYLCSYPSLQKGFKRPPPNQR